MIANPLYTKIRLRLLLPSIYIAAMVGQFLCFPFLSLEIAFCFLSVLFFCLNYPLANCFLFGFAVLPAFNSVLSSFSYYLLSSF